MSIVPAPWDAGAGESLEPGSLFTVSYMVRPLHSGLGDKVESLFPK